MALEKHSKFAWNHPNSSKKCDRKKENESFICVLLLSLDKNEFWIKGKRKDHKHLYAGKIYILHSHTHFWNDSNWETFEKCERFSDFDWSFCVIWSWVEDWKKILCLQTPELFDRATNSIFFSNPQLLVKKDHEIIRL